MIFCNMKNTLEKLLDNFKLLEKLFSCRLYVFNLKNSDGEYVRLLLWRGLLTKRKQQFTGVLDNNYFEKFRKFHQKTPTM